MKLITATLLLVAGSAASAQVPIAWSKPGSCDAGAFHCDAVTVAHLDDGKTLLQFSEYAGHITSYVGSEGSEDPTLVDLDGVYLDGLTIPRANGQCALIFKAPEQLETITCPGLTFTVKDSK
jgi:hypothetical protein